MTTERLLSNHQLIPCPLTQTAVATERIEKVTARKQGLARTRKQYAVFIAQSFLIDRKHIKVHYVQQQADEL